MLKQKIAQVKEYIRVKKKLKELDAAKDAVFKADIVASGNISISKDKQIPEVEPRAEFWGSPDYPCVVIHQHDWCSVCGNGKFYGDIDTKIFYCPDNDVNEIGIMVGPCKKVGDCMHKAKNQAAFAAKQDLDNCLTECDEIKAKVDEVRKQLFGGLWPRKKGK